MTAAPHVLELGHIVLYVSDVDRSAEFYGTVLGWQQIMKPELGMRAAAFSGGRTHHELLLIEVGAGAEPIPRVVASGMYHFGLKIGDTDDQLRAMIERLAQFPELVRLVGASDHTVTHSLYVVDPDGNEIELYVDVPEGRLAQRPVVVRDADQTAPPLTSPRPERGNGRHPRRDRSRDRDGGTDCPTTGRRRRCRRS